MVDSLVVSNSTANGPHHGVGKDGIMAHLQIFRTHCLQRFHVFLRIVIEKSVAEACDALHEAHVQERAGEVELLPNAFDVCFEVVGEEQVKRTLRSSIHLVAPTVNIRPPADVGLVDEQDTTSRDCGRTGVLHVLDLEKHAHCWRKGDALVTHQRQDLVVIHHRVHGLDPCGVNITIKNHPFVLVTWLVPVHLLAHVAHDHGNQAVLPLLRLRHNAIQLVGRNGLGICLLPLPILANVPAAVQQGLPSLRLATACGANDEAAVPHCQDVQQAHNFDDECRVWLKAASLCNFGHHFFKFRILEGIWPDSGKQVLNEPQEDRHIQRCDLGCVEIS
mmetsp:Transcript_144900/g.263450  ORF Transcript_144900/g.263450 Transcript_144900/m.263450 type:complete len:333 (-) Transcript_144900:467-1465(-)